MDPLSAERIAHNEHLFRVANQQIDAAAVEQGLRLPVPFICECADPTCTELLRIQPTAYRELRENPRRFFVVSGHEGDATALVERGEGYEVVEKLGHAGAVAERLAGEDAS